jgi:sterol 14alpha-demethylase
VFVSPNVSHRLSSVYTNPDKYDPDRFAAGREEDQKQPFSYLGFGGGRHGCMGEMFAYLQIKTIWSVLLRNFEMELVGKCPEPDYSAMVVGMFCYATLHHQSHTAPMISDTHTRLADMCVWF